MTYPTLAEVEAADRIALCRWWRFLDSPENDSEFSVMNRIVERFNECGGFTPQISKLVGWEHPP